MREDEIVITDEGLPKKWFDDANIGLETIKKTIASYNKNGEYDFYNNNEDLSEDKAIEKQAIKEHNIVLPITYCIEKFIKSLVIKYNLNDNFNRNTGVKKILNNVKSLTTITGNFHNTAMYIEYLNSIEPTFLNVLGRIYMSKREGYGHFTKRSNLYTTTMLPNERIKYTSELYQNAFIEYRYLYEKQESENLIDLVKLIDYAESIRDACLYFIIKQECLIIARKLLNNNKEIEEFEETIGDSYNLSKRYDNYKDYSGATTTIRDYLDIGKLIFLMRDYIHNYIRKKGYEFCELSNSLGEIIDKAYNIINKTYVPEFASYCILVNSDFLELDNTNLNEKEKKLCESGTVMPISVYYNGQLSAGGYISQKNNIASLEYIFVKDLGNELEIIKKICNYIFNNKELLESFFGKEIEQISINKKIKIDSELYSQFEFNKSIIDEGNKKIS